MHIELADLGSFVSFYRRRYSNNTESVPHLSTEFSVMKQKTSSKVHLAGGFRIVTVWNTALRTFSQRLIVEFFENWRSPKVSSVNRDMDL
jgi:hypothetical protein